MNDRIETGDKRQTTLYNSYPLMARERHAAGESRRDRENSEETQRQR